MKEFDRKRSFGKESYPTVKELREALARYTDDTLVVIEWEDQHVGPVISDDLQTLDHLVGDPVALIIDANNY